MSLRLSPRRGPFVLQIRKQEEVSEARRGASVTPARRVRGLIRRRHDRSAKGPSGECHFVHSTTAFEAVVGERYELTAGTPEPNRCHKEADRLALASKPAMSSAGRGGTWGTRS
jgi:hypothetical protein